MLAEVEVEAAELDWADRRPWRVDTHVFAEGPLPVIDLHDLNSRLTKRAVRAVCAIGSELDAGAVRWITGRGRHSVGPGGVLRHVVASELRKQSRGKPWRFRAAGAGWVLITNAERAPRAATGELGPLFWVLAVLFVVAVVVALANQLGFISP